MREGVRLFLYPLLTFMLVYVVQFDSSRGSIRLDWEYVSYVILASAIFTALGFLVMAITAPVGYRFLARLTFLFRYRRLQEELRFRARRSSLSKMARWLKLSAHKLEDKQADPLDEAYGNLMLIVMVAQLVVLLFPLLLMWMNFGGWIKNNHVAITGLLVYVTVTMLAIRGLPLFAKLLNRGIGRIRIWSRSHLGWFLPLITIMVVTRGLRFMFARVLLQPSSTPTALGWWSTKWNHLLPHNTPPSGDLWLDVILVLAMMPLLWFSYAALVISIIDSTPLIFGSPQQNQPS